MKQELLQESRQLEQRVNEISIEIERLNKKSQSLGARTQSLLEEYAMLILNANTTMEGASATTSIPSHNVAEVDAGLSMDDPSMMTDP
jgi:cell division septum initiation protein DivIVA